MRKPMGGQFTKLKLRGELKTKRLRSAEAKRRIDVLYAKDKIEEDAYWEDVKLRAASGNANCAEAISLRASLKRVA